MSAPLGDFLRDRRASVTPGQVGIASFGTRRVPGLRREEIAMLAGVSVDYYIRLEQGRERNPSAQVLDSLSDVLHLDTDARSHLFRLAGIGPRPRPVSGPEHVHPALAQMLQSWPDNPAVILGRAYDVLASNDMAQALFGDLTQMPNVLERMFAHPTARVFYADWNAAARSAVGGFRLHHGQWPNDPRILDVLARMEREYTDFRTLWRRNNVVGKQLESKSFHHPSVGLITLSMQAFDVRAAPGQQLVVYSAPLNSPDAEKIRLLGSLAASQECVDRAVSSDSDM